jgi:RHS repeat-associated protein
MFVGQLRDGPSVYYMRAREYDSDLGRFSAPDPIEASPDEAMSSGYAYAADRPTFLVDPTGLTSEPSSEALDAALEATSAADVSGELSTLQTYAMRPDSPIRGRPNYGEAAFRLVYGGRPSNRTIRVLMLLTLKGVKGGIHWHVDWDWAAFRPGQTVSNRTRTGGESGWGGSFDLSRTFRLAWRAESGRLFGAASFNIYTLYGHGGHFLIADDDFESPRE